MDSLKILIIGPVNAFGGYGSVVRCYIDGLMQLGCDVKIDSYDDYHVGYPLGHLRQSLYSEASIKNHPGWQPDVILNCSSMNWRKSMIPQIVSTSWETDKLDNRITTTINNVNAIALWSSYNRHVYDNIHSNVSIVPLGVDTVTFDKKLNFNSAPNETFTVLSNGKWEYRKNFSTLIKAFSNVFGGNKKAFLKIHTFPFNASMEEIQQIAAMYNTNGTNIEISTGNMTEAELVKWYHSGDVYAMASRAEGFGVPYLEAMSCGLPLISSKVGGHRDFVSDDVSFLVDGDIREVIPHSVYQHGSKMFEPSQKSFESALRAAYSNQQQLAKMGENARLRAEEFSNINVAKKMKIVMDEVIRGVK